MLAQTSRAGYQAGAGQEATDRIPHEDFHQEFRAAPHRQRQHPDQGQGQGGEHPPVGFHEGSEEAGIALEQEGYPQGQQHREGAEDPLGQEGEAQAHPEQGHPAVAVGGLDDDQEGQAQAEGHGRREGHVDHGHVADDEEQVTRGHHESRPGAGPGRAEAPTQVGGPHRRGHGQQGRRQAQHPGVEGPEEPTAERAQGIEEGWFLQVGLAVQGGDDPVARIRHLPDDAAHIGFVVIPQRVVTQTDQEEQSRCKTCPQERLPAQPAAAGKADRVGLVRAGRGKHGIAGGASEYLGAYRMPGVSLQNTRSSDTMPFTVFTPLMSL